MTDTPTHAGRLHTARLSPHRGWISPVLLYGLLGANAPVAAKKPAPNAPAASPSVALLAMQYDGLVTQGVRSVVSQRLTQGLTAVGFRRCGTAAAGDKVRPLAGKCRDRSCWRRVWVQLGCRYLVGGTVRGDDGSYDIELWLTDARAGKLLARSRERCDICGMKAVAEKVELAASALSARLMSQKRAPTRLAIEVQPAQATVSINNQVVGRGSREVLLASGSHKLRVEADGFQPATRTIAAISGLHEPLRIRLTPKRDPDSWMPTAGWVGVGAGLAAIGSGIALVIADGSATGCTNEQTVVAGQCPEIVDTATGGWVLTLAGAAAVLGGGYVLFRALSNAPKR